MANVILFTTEKSAQTTKKKTWNPYRLKGGGNGSGYVTLKPLANSEGKFTLIAFANATLLTKAVELMGMSVDGQEATQAARVDGNAREEEEKDIGIGEDAVRVDVPKFHINGGGEFSGMGKWEKIVKEIKILYMLFAGCSLRTTLHKKDFPDFNGEEVSWDDFENKVEDLDLSRYNVSIQALKKFKDQTLNAIKLFQKQVTEKPYTAGRRRMSFCQHVTLLREWNGIGCKYVQTILSA
jgi:hypothetical protein